jgi:hypothetical protein
MSGASRLELEKQKSLFVSNNIARRMTESTVQSEKTCGFFCGWLMKKRGR